MNAKPYSDLSPAIGAAVDIASAALGDARRAFIDTWCDGGFNLGEAKSGWLAILTDAVSVEIGLFDPESHSDALTGVVTSLVADHSASAVPQ